MALHWIDLTILGIVTLSILTGLIRGFVKELIAFCAWVAAIWVALHHTQWASTWLKPYIADTTIRNIASVIVVLLATLILGGIVNMVVSFFIKRSGLTSMDRVLGMGFGFARGVFIVSLLLVVVRMTSLPQEQYMASSRLYSAFNPVVDWLAARMPTVIEQIKDIDKKNNLLDLAIDLGDIEVEQPSAMPKTV